MTISYKEIKTKNVDEVIKILKDFHPYTIKVYINCEMYDYDYYTYTEEEQKKHLKDLLKLSEFTFTYQDDEDGKKYIDGFSAKMSFHMDFSKGKFIECDYGYRYRYTKIDKFMYDMGTYCNVYINEIPLQKCCSNRRNEINNLKFYIEGLIERYKAPMYNIDGASTIYLKGKLSW